jgi:AbrB family looped-hinge helix DNA binding protein
MTLIRVDQKMRVRLPKHVREKLGIRGREPLDIEVSGDRAYISKPKKVDISADPVIRDMVERPMHSEIKVTSKLLNRWKDEMWMP